MLLSSRPVTVEVTLRGGADYQDGGLARTMVERAIGYARCPARWAEVEVELHPDVQTTCPAEVRAVVDVDGTQVRAGGVGPTPAAAVELAGIRLRSELVRVKHRAQTARWVPRRRHARVMRLHR